jgi:hypothetical protein
MPVPMCVRNCRVIAYWLVEDVRTIEEPPTTVPVGCEPTTMGPAGRDYRLDRTCLTTAWQLERAGICVTTGVYREGTSATMWPETGRLRCRQ